MPQPDIVYQRQFKSFVWNFVEWSARVLCGVHIGQAAEDDDLDSILEQLSKDENNPLHSFWWSIRYQYDLFKTQLRAQPQNQEPDFGEVDMKTVLEILQPGIICAIQVIEL